MSNNKSKSILGGMYTPSTLYFDSSDPAKPLCVEDIEVAINRWKPVEPRVLLEMIEHVKSNSKSFSKCGYVPSVASADKTKKFFVLYRHKTVNSPIMYYVVLPKDLWDKFDVSVNGSLAGDILGTYANGLVWTELAANEDFIKVMNDLASWNLEHLTSEITRVVDAHRIVADIMYRDITAISNKELAKVRLSASQEVYIKLNALETLYRELIENPNDSVVKLVGTLFTSATGIRPDDYRVNYYEPKIY